MEQEKLNNGIMNGKRGIVMGVANDRSIDRKHSLIKVMHLRKESDLLLKKLVLIL